MIEEEIYGMGVCAGGGGLELALDLAVPGYRGVVYVEREAFATAILASRMEEGSLAPAPVWTDLHTFDPEPFRGKVDLVSAGFPCQPSSVAGDRRGLADDRWIWPEVLRVIRGVRPGVVVIENVPGLITVHGGMDAVLGGLASCGFDAEWDTFQAAEVGATHKRDRIFILALAHGDTRGRRLVERIASAHALTPSGRDAERCDAGMADAASVQLAGLEPTDERRDRPGGGELADAPGGRRGVGGKPSVADRLAYGRDEDVADSGRRRRKQRGGTGDGRVSESIAGSGRQLAVAGHTERAAGEIHEGRTEGEARALTPSRDRSVADAGRTRKQRRRVAGDLDRASGGAEGKGDQRERGGDAAGDSGATEPRCDHCGDEVGWGQTWDRERHEAYRGLGCWNHGCPGAIIFAEPDPVYGYLADAGSGQLPEPGTGSRRRNGTRPTGAVGTVGDADRAGLEGRRREDAERPDEWDPRAASLPLFPPGPTDVDAWQRIVGTDPDLAPATYRQTAATESALRVMVDGASDLVDASLPEIVRLTRIDALRLLGNGVVPSQAAFALIILARRMVAADGVGDG